MFVSVSVQGWELNRYVCVCVEKHLFSKLAGAN